MRSRSSAGRTAARASGWSTGTTANSGSRHNSCSCIPGACGCDSVGSTARTNPSAGCRRSPSSCQPCSDSATLARGCATSNFANTSGNNGPPIHGVVSTANDSSSIARNTPIADRAEPTSARMSRAWVAKIRPGRSDGGRSAGAVDQQHAELPLERRDVRAHPRLRAVDLRGRSREPAAVDDREVGLQPVQFHPNMIRTCARFAPVIHPGIACGEPMDQVLPSVSRIVSLG